MTPIRIADGPEPHDDATGLRVPDRRSAPRVGTQVDAEIAGAPATILDISLDGVRFEVPDAGADLLGSRFRLQVPSVGIDVELQRAWVRRVVGATAECGALLVSPDPSQEMAWQRLFEMAITTSTPAGRHDDGPRPVPAEPHLAAWVSPLLASQSVGGWSHHLARLR